MMSEMTRAIAPIERKNPIHQCQITAIMSRECTGSTRNLGSRARIGRIEGGKHSIAQPFGHFTSALVVHEALEILMELKGRETRRAVIEVTLDERTTLFIELAVEECVEILDRFTAIRF